MMPRISSPAVRYSSACATPSMRPASSSKSRVCTVLSHPAFAMAALYGAATVAEQANAAFCLEAQAARGLQ